MELSVGSFQLPALYTPAASPNSNGQLVYIYIYMKFFHSCCSSRAKGSEVIESSLGNMSMDEKNVSEEK